MGGENTVNGFSVKMHLNGGGVDKKYASGERIFERESALLLQVIMWILVSNRRNLQKCWFGFVSSVCLSNLVLAMCEVCSVSC